LPFSHIMGPHFIADASCAMKASSKKELDASDRIAIAPMNSLLLHRHTRQHRTQPCLEQIFTFCLLLYATLRWNCTLSFLAPLDYPIQAKFPKVVGLNLR